MPDMTIPAAIGVTLGVIACALLALQSGDYRASAFAGCVGTVFNLVCFYRRLYLQAKAEQSRRKPRA